MSDLSQHSEWLSLIEVSGPFLAEPVLKDAFPQGLEGLDGAKKKLVRQAYDEWREAVDLDDPDALKIHKAWIELVLRQGLELDEDGSGDVLKRGADLGDIKCERPEHGVTLTPDFAVVDGQGGPPLMLVAVYEPQVVLSEALKQGTWSASSGERMVELCRATGVRLGLVTNGEQWMFVDAPVGAVTTFASWYGRLWAQEPITLQAFVSLLGIRRFFVDRSEQLPALLDNSLKYQDEVTDALGEQVRRAVEVLIQALDRAHVDSNRTLLEGVEPAELYEAGLTVMMRIVFLLSAEERGLLLLGDALYEANYAVSTLRLQLRAESEEILERRLDAWSRLLSLFRAVYGGIDHEALRLPALGGSLFDPDRFPFLEGRTRGSRWKVDLARPLPIDNRTVLLLLEAVQLFRGRTLSYMALDVEQIGYVYEGLLERTVVRAAEVTLDLDATKAAMNPWVTLPEIEDAAAQGQDALETLLKDRTESSASRVRNDLNRLVDDDAAEKLLTACHADRGLRDRVKPYFHFLRTDPWGYPLVYPKGTFMVASGSDRRETGTHYTPKSLTEIIVKETLEPLAYFGPIEGKPRASWRLKMPADLLDLKICDPAMGSGAFLVQVCRWLSERLVEAWADAEARGQSVTAEGDVVEDIGGREPLRPGSEERLVTARRLIAERCLYGVDLNPLAVELAKLSIWLVTLARGRPFGFLDHNLRCGDSLLGIAQIEQLHYLALRTGSESSKTLFTHSIDQALTEAIELRIELRSKPISDIRDVEAMAGLDEQARRALLPPIIIADGLVGEYLVARGKSVDITTLSIWAGDTLNGNAVASNSLVHLANKYLNQGTPSGGAARRPFHWPIEFPEVFVRERPGFDAIVGNPPFMGGKKVSGKLGSDYRTYIVEYITDGLRGESIDLVTYFFRQAFRLIRESGTFGLIATNGISQGDSRRAGLDGIISNGGEIILAHPNVKWPGTAAVLVSLVFVFKGQWASLKKLSGRTVSNITSYLSEASTTNVTSLNSNKGRAFTGSYVLGTGFTLPARQALDMIAQDESLKDVLYPYLIGKDINSSIDHQASRWIINFWDWPLSKAEKYGPLIDILRRDVKPQRDLNNRKIYREKWWRYAEPVAGLYKAIGRGDLFLNKDGTHGTKVSEVIVACRVTRYLSHVFVNAEQVFDIGVNVFLPTPGVFGVLESEVYEAWVRSQCSTMKTDIRYTINDGFMSFPFPFLSTLQVHAMEEASSLYSQFRARLMKSDGLGLTKVLNKYNDPEITSNDYRELRSLKANITKRVIEAFGWSDLELNFDFYNLDDMPPEDNVRYGLSYTTRSELVSRLSSLNSERAGS